MPTNLQLVSMLLGRVLYYNPNLILTVNGKRQKVWYPTIASDGTPCTTSRNQEGVRLTVLKPIHTRHDTVWTVLSCLAGGVNWALSAATFTIPKTAQDGDIVTIED